MREQEEKQARGTAITKTETKMPIEVGQRGLVLRNLEDMYRFGQYIAASGFAPKGLEKPEAIVVAIQFGLELGITPMQALQNIAVINGRPTLYGDAMLALCMASLAFDHSVFAETFEGKPYEDSYCAICRVGRCGCNAPVERRFSVAQAKKAGLWGKAGPWQMFPDRMLQMRARAWALRDAFPDILRGAMAAEEAVGVNFTNDGVSTQSASEALAAKLSCKRSVQEEPIPDGGHSVVAEAAAREVAAGPNGTIPPVGAAANVGSPVPPPETAQNETESVDAILHEFNII